MSHENPKTPTITTDRRPSRLPTRKPVRSTSPSTSPPIRNRLESSHRRRRARSLVPVRGARDAGAGRNDVLGLGRVCRTGSIASTPGSRAGGCGSSRIATCRSTCTASRCPRDRRRPCRVAIEVTLEAHARLHAAAARPFRVRARQRLGRRVRGHQHRLAVGAAEPAVLRRTPSRPRSGRGHGAAVHAGAARRRLAAGVDRWLRAGCAGAGRRRSYAAKSPAAGEQLSGTILMALPEQGVLGRGARARGWRVPRGHAQGRRRDGHHGLAVELSRVGRGPREAFREVEPAGVGQALCGETLLLSCAVQPVHRRDHPARMSGCSSPRPGAARIGAGRPRRRR